MTPKKRVETATPGTASPGSNSSKKLKAGGFSSIKSYSDFVDRFGSIPAELSSEHGFFGGTHAAKKVPVLDPRVKATLLQLASRAVVQFRHIIYTGTREKPLYIFFSTLIASLRHGSLIISAAGLEDEEGGGDDEPVQLEEDPGILAVAHKVLLGFEEEIPGENARGPMELVILRAPDMSAHEVARQQGLCFGLDIGCEAAVAIELKALLNFNNIWQALAAGIELALKNRKPGKAAAPVCVVLSNARSWYFFSLQALGPSHGKGQQADAAGNAEATDGTQAAGAVTGCVFELKLSSGTSEKFRLFDCASVAAEMIGPPVSLSATLVVEVMYRLYMAMYPDEDISKLPDLVERGNVKAAADADVWMKTIQENADTSPDVLDVLGAKAAAEAEVAQLRKAAVEQMAALQAATEQAAALQARVVELQCQLADKQREGAAPQGQATALGQGGGEVEQGGESPAAEAVQSQGQLRGLSAGAAQVEENIAALAVSQRGAGGPAHT